MAALASLGALALLLLSGLSCCSGSGLAGVLFWRASHPRLVVRRGRTGASRAGVWAFSLREAGGLWSRRPRLLRFRALHTFTQKLSCWKKQPDLCPVCSSEEDSQSLSVCLAPAPAGKVTLVPAATPRASGLGSWGWGGRSDRSEALQHSVIRARNWAGGEEPLDLMWGQASLGMGL